MRHDKYILVGRDAVPCDNLLEWAKLFESGDRRVAIWEGNGVIISTVFLGLNHSYDSSDEDSPPLIFETMVFPQGTLDEIECERYSTWQEAEDGHRAMVEKYTKR